MTLDSSTIQIPKRLLMGPGPSEVDPRVYKAMMQPVIGYLDPVLFQILDQLQDRLRSVFRTRNTVTLPISATGGAGMEASLYNFIEPGDSVAVLIGGLFASRIGDIAGRCGANVIRIDHSPGKAADLDHVRSVLKGKKSKILAAVHSETSTGVYQQIEPLRKIADDTGALLLIDTVSSLGGIPVEVDAWGIDICYSGSQKCLGCPPGLSPITVSDRAAQAMREKKTPAASWYLDLQLISQYWSKERKYHHTPPITMLYALNESLRLLLDEGLEVACERHRRSHLALVEGLSAMGLSMFVEDRAARAWTLNTIRIPKGVDDAKVRVYLLERFGIEIGAGIGDMRGSIWRVGLLGLTAKAECVLLLLHALESALIENGFSCNKGAGVAAAEKIYQTAAK